MKTVTASFEFSQGAFNSLKQLQTETNKKDLAEVVHAALSLYKFLLERQADGNVVLVSCGDTDLEVVLP